MSPMAFDGWCLYYVGRDISQMGSASAKCCCLNWHKSKMSSLFQWVSLYPSVSKQLKSNETS